MKKENTPVEFFPQTESEFLASVVQAGQDAFWQKCHELSAERFGITTGDLDPGAAMALEQAMKEALAAWVAANRTR